MFVVKKALDLYFRLLQVMVGLLMAALIVPVSMQVLGRPIDLPMLGEIRVLPRFLWTEELAIFLFIWIVMLGSAIAVRESTHFDVDLLPEPKSDRVKGALRLLVHVAMGVLAWFFIKDGWEYFEFGSRQYADVLRVRLVVVYITVPLAGASWGIFLLEHMVYDIRAILGLGTLDDDDPGLGDVAEDAQDLPPETSL